MNSPVFSIIVPCYNHSHWLSTSVSSVRQQAFDRWELIIVNDGSTDQTEEIAGVLAAQDNRIRLITQSNQGLSAARNTGIQQANGTWCVFMDADDYLLPNVLTKLQQAVTVDNEIGIVQVGHLLVDDAGTEIARKYPIQYPNETFLDAVSRGNIGPPLSLCTRRQVIESIGTFDTTLTSAEDWDFWIRAARLHVKRLILSEPGVAYRHTAGSMSRNPWRMYENTAAVIDRLPLSDPRLPSTIPGNAPRPELCLTPLRKRNLIQSVGLAVMQGQIDTAFERFQQESKQLDLAYLPSDFAYMNSFLSMRDFYRKEDATYVLQEVKPKMKQFFERCSFPFRFSQLALHAVLRGHERVAWSAKYRVAGLISSKLKNLMYSQLADRSAVQRVHV